MWLGRKPLCCQVSGRCQSSADWNLQVFHTVNVCLTAAGWILPVLDVGLAIRLSALPFVPREAFIAIFSLITV